MNGMKEKIVAAVIGAFITAIGSLIGVYATVQTHSAQIKVLESAVGEIQKDVKQILRELK